MEDDAALIPRSARVKFALIPSKAVEQSTEYTALKEETEAVVTRHQLELKEQVLKMTRLEIQTSKTKLCDDFASAIRLIVQTKILFDDDIR